MINLFFRWQITFSVFFMGLLAHPALWAQAAIPIGTWRTHFAYQKIKHVEVTPSRIYGAAENGLFYFDKTDNSFNILSKTNGLSDIGISAMAYQPAADALLLAYRSGIVDLVSNNRVAAFTLIRDAGNEELINHIQFAANMAFLATNKGIRVLQLSAEDSLSIAIKESDTNLGKTGDNLIVYSSTIAHDSIFLATAEGVIAASLSPQTNRQDFRRWRRFGMAEGIPSQAVRFIVTLEEQVYVGLDGQGLFVYNGSSWAPAGVTTDKTFEALRIAGNQLVMILGDSIVLYTKGSMTAIEDKLITRPYDAMVDHEGVLWIGDGQNGLVSKQNNTFSNFFPEGPGSDHIAGLRYLNHKIVALQGSEPGVQGAFYVFEKGNWTNYESDSNLPAIAPLLDAAYDPASSHYYFASFGSGILDWDGSTGFSLINNSDKQVTLMNNQLTSLAGDRNSTLWVADFNAAASLHAFHLSEKTWQPFSFDQAESRFPLKIVLPEDDHPWILLNDSPDLSEAGKDILVFNPETEDELYIKAQLSGDALPGDEITAMVKDKHGQIWIGGNEGVAYFPDPWDIFSGVEVVKPVFGTQFLLLGEHVTSIAIDGGNRKWIGTRRGLWLFDATGETLINSFTTENSPLISNVITDISVNDADGEVFIATDRGIVSYRGTASEGTPQHQSVKIFPNPVLSGFAGMVGIAGLAANATVKITSVAGILVRQLEAEGGTATWDVRDYRGQRVGTGVYLVFSATDDGQDTFVGKIAVID